MISKEYKPNFGDISKLGLYSLVFLKYTVYYIEDNNVLIGLNSLSNNT